MRYAHSFLLLALLVFVAFLGGSPPAFALDREARKSVAVVLSWYSALGASNGRVGWKRGGFAYSREFEGTSGRKWTDLLRNAPDVARQFLNEPVIDYRNASYEQLVRKAATEELKQIKEAGFDVFAFDMQPRPDFDSQRELSPKNEPFTFFYEFLIWLDVAKNIGLQGCIFADVWNMSGDFPNKAKLSPDRWVEVLVAALRTAKTERAYWLKNGSPVVFHFATDKRMKAAPDPDADDVDGGWRNIVKRVRTQESIYFVADARRPDIEGDSWLGWADAIYMFSPASPTKYMVDFQSQVAEKYGARYFWSASPGYYRPKLSFVAPSLKRLDEVYSAAVESKSQILVWETWNDFEEETDIVPSMRKGRALFDLVGCYNEWFKTRRQFQCKDSITLAFLNNSVKEQVTPVPTWWGRNPLWSERKVTKNIYYWIFNKASATRSLECGKTKILIKSGVNVGEIDRDLIASNFCSYNGDRFDLSDMETVDVEGNDSHALGLRYNYIHKVY